MISLLIYFYSIFFVRSIMELKLTDKKKILVVFTMILVQATLEMELTTSAAPTEIQHVERTLLKLLGMKRKPIVDRTKVFVPQAMIDIYERRLKNVYGSTSLPLPGRLTRSANVVRSYTHQESSIDEKFQRNHKFRLNFNLKNFPANELLTSAELQLTIVPNEKPNSNCSHRISIKDIVLPGVKGKTKPILRIVDTKVVNAGINQTLSLDVLPVVERWLSESDKNFGLLIDVEPTTSDSEVTSHVRLKRDVDQEQWRPIQPLLLVYSDDSVNRKPTNWTEVIRRRRSSPTVKHRRRKNECRRRQLWVDFEKVGWNDWIVAPAGYEAYYCDGECPSQFGDHMNTTNHAIVQTLVHSVHPQTIPKPCCVPTTLTPISMLYVDEDHKSVLKHYQDMIVEGCGCR